MPTTFANGMLDRAYRSLDRAASCPNENGIYVSAFLAASQAAAAIVSTRISPEQASRMRRPKTLWEALTIAEPELQDWAHYFSSRAVRRDRAEKAVPNAVYREQAEELLTDTTQFLTVAEGIVQAMESA